MKKIMALVLVLVVLSGCSTNVDTQTDMIPETSTPNPTPTPIPQEEIIKAEIQHIYDTKLEAVLDKDIEKYLSTVSSSDYYYYNEQKRWFTEMTTEGFKDIFFTVEAIEILSDDKIIATVHQTHFYLEAFDITYPIIFIKENNVYMDAGYDFLIYEGDGYTIKYQEGETKVEAFNIVIQEVYDNLSQIFLEKPDPNFQIKLFHDREMLRQRTIPSIQWLFTGWGEANESLKLYTGHASMDGYRGTIQHEMVHHITMRICNNNLPGWLADGIALQYGNYMLEGGNAIELGYATKEQVSLTIEYLETFDLWTATDREIIDGWYNASQMYVEYIIDVYGHDKLMELFYEAGNKPYNENVMNDHFAEANNQTLEEVLLTVLGKTKQEVSADYLEWLNNNY